MLPFDPDKATGLYILDAAGEPLAEPSITRWAAWFQDGERRLVARTRVGEVEVSTVFLGMTDHSEPPRWWETMLFPECDECYRCSGSREQALAQHERVVGEHLQKYYGNQT